MGILKFYQFGTNMGDTHVLTNENQPISSSYADHKKELEQGFYDFIFANTSSTLFWRKWIILHEKFLKEIENDGLSPSTNLDMPQTASLFLKKRSGLITTMEQILRHASSPFPTSKDGAPPLLQFFQLIQTHDSLVSQLLQSLRSTLSEELKVHHNARKATKAYEQTHYHVQGGST